MMKEDYPGWEDTVGIILSYAFMGAMIIAIILPMCTTCYIAYENYKDSRRISTVSLSSAFSKLESLKKKHRPQQNRWYLTDDHSFEIVHDNHATP